MTMTGILSDGQVLSYHENGYLVVPGLVSVDEVEELREDVVRICRGEYSHENLPELDASLSAEEVLRTFLCIHHVHKISPVMLETGVKQPGLAQVLSQIIGPEVKCMQSMLFVKPPGFQGQAWHQDEMFIPTRDRSLTGGWIALDDATEENSCLRVIPGSNHGIIYDSRPHENPEEFDFAPECYGFDESGEITVEVKAGDAVFFNGYLLHRSLKNRSQQYRRVLVNHYMNAWSLLPWRPQENLNPARWDYRDIVMICGEDPYAHKGTEDLANVSIRTCKAAEEAMAAD
ncbi:MAG: phytanoyl-CoA dioxygenase family protein [Candidatus Latescibacterota bacterium]|nr:phytanoyl-CoA dioxygenase family protein [Candidatus Latescibacterota bacterium]